MPLPLPCRFLSLRMQYKAEQTENEIPAVIEHNFKDGRMWTIILWCPVPPCWLMNAVSGLWRQNREHPVSAAERTRRTVAGAAARTFYDPGDHL